MSSRYANGISLLGGHEIRRLERMVSRGCQIRTVNPGSHYAEHRNSIESPRYGSNPFPELKTYADGEAIPPVDPEDIKRMRPRVRIEGEGWSWHQDMKAKLSPGADFVAVSSRCDMIATMYIYKLLAPWQHGEEFWKRFSPSLDQVVSHSDKEVAAEIVATFFADFLIDNMDVVRQLEESFRTPNGGTPPDILDLFA